ncbi:ribosome biogenesis GTP-binding protein YihA/YsxC [Patescibacteria group bacterium]|nr:ribosome biogenesis GTP-binding protein YihA/YsxC [Patescibacteria group bacterium]MBU1246429.1 ribosome biogenesis GTP-binding protein YihA/YsxC [Patescibacteria group bacterium]MBU1519515.1 ribosome biogenesis GTP-binding protein YihA/YsxC [Patescibacteria group bacterium]MBU1730027.1 ribosome biogenesis GTP-binding protein YihA/YsxC [Patescibacteria group bacterium]MBU1956236.1 ribosome biogenesis GTP-binding protein YihA/YsxC [Patescibacteria group bacterium]
MKITNVEFVKGVIGDNYSLDDGLPHIAFLGRSNVGKSSTINSLLNRKNLVRVSKKPGKTREANFYCINDICYFVDFPGYGYAKCSQKERDKLAKRILWYIQHATTKPNIVVLIIDAQVGITPTDDEMIKTLKNNHHQIIIIANKIDKLNQKSLVSKISAIKNKVSDVDIFPYSAQTKQGQEKLLELFGSILTTGS